jgi:hypothetical protein
VVECDLAKVEVAGSNPVSRSRISNAAQPSPGSLASSLMYVEESAPMTYRRLLWALLFVTISLALACGSNRLTSVSVSPAVADARNFPNAQVQFIASGTYSGSSHPVTVNNLSWCVGSSSGLCNGNIASAASVNGNGVAQCLSGESGMVTVIAGTGGAITPPDIGQQFTVFGTAQLTCP